MKELKWLHLIPMSILFLCVFFLSCKHTKDESHENDKTQDVQEELFLKDLMVDGNKRRNIQYEMDAGKTRKEKISIKAQANIEEAKISYDKQLEGNMWLLEKGENILKITLKHGNISKEYILKLEKVTYPLLTRIDVAGDVRYGEFIQNEMEFSVEAGTSEVSVMCATDPDSIIPVFEPNLKDGTKLELLGKETNLKITLLEDSEKTEYNVIVKLKSFELPHKKMYGFFGNGKYINGFGWGAFYLDKLDDIQAGGENFSLIFPYQTPTGVFSGAYLDGMYYAFEFEYGSNGVTPTDFVSFDLSTKEKKVISKYAEGNLQFRVLGMSYDYLENIMYAITPDGLQKVDLENGSFELATTLAKKLGTLAINKKGEFYGMGQDGILYKINKKTGRCDAVIETIYKRMYTGNSMEFDRTTGLLYWSSCTAARSKGAESYMVEFDLSKSPVEVREVGKVGYEATLYSLSIPFAKDGEASPSAVENLLVTPNKDGAQKASISWQNPTKTFEGSPLSKLKSVSIMRDGIIITTLENAQIGSEMRFEDENIPQGGWVKYAVYATNDVGDGEKAFRKVWIGPDAPDVPNNIEVEVGDGCKTATIKWESPTKGLHGGYFNVAGVTYKVVRYPGEVVLQDNINTLQYIDTSITELQRYYYKVFAKNAIGESGQFTYDYVIGSALSCPVEENFSNGELFYKKWTPIDANKDNFTWVYNSPFANQAFGSGIFGAEYILNATIPHSKNDADEWLISPPVNFESAKIYEVILEARSLAEEDIEITLGKNNVHTTQEVKGSIKIEKQASPQQSGSPVPLKTYKLELPSNIDGIKCVGIHLVSKYPSNGTSHLQIGKIIIKEK